METKTKVRQIVLELIESVIEGDTAEVQDNHLFRELGVDSLTALDVLTALEREFKVKIGEESMRRFTTIDGVSAVVEEVLARKAAA